MNLTNMKRLTTDNPKGNLESILNFAYAKDNKVHLACADEKYDADLCEYVAKLAKAKGYDFSPGDIMEEGLFEYYEEDFVVLYYLAVQAAELRERLKMYEDQLENGTLIELPCKIGTRVFEVRSYYDCKTDAYCECQNFGFRGEKACLCCENNTRKNAISASYFNLKMRDRIGKTIFLTKEEAEARLKELKENG